MLAVLAVVALLGGELAPVTGGSPSSDDAVVALARGGVLICSATIIGPHAVLTAAHCLSDSQLPDVVEGDALAGGVHHPVLAAFVHPLFDAATLDHDLALVIVDPPLAVPPVPYATALRVQPGDTIRVIGYGWTVANDPLAPARRTGTSHVDTVEALRLASSGAPSQACEGDSGGPALFDPGTGEQIVGVASSGDPACTQLAHHTRVDLHADFIAGIVARTAAGGAGAGDRCWYADHCAAGSCTPALDEPRLSFCTPACDAGACPSGLTCSDGLCRHPAPSPGAAGSTCAADADCADTLCLAPAAATATVCTRRCFSDLPGFTCPSGMTCGSASDGGEACFATPDPGGCQTTHGAASWLVVTAGALLLRRRIRGGVIVDDLPA